MIPPSQQPRNVNNEPSSQSPSPVSSPSSPSPISSPSPPSSSFSPQPSSFSSTAQQTSYFNGPVQSMSSLDQSSWQQNSQGFSLAKIPTVQPMAFSPLQLPQTHKKLKHKKHQKVSSNSKKKSNNNQLNTIVNVVVHPFEVAHPSVKGKSIYLNKVFSFKESF